MGIQQQSSQLTWAWAQQRIWSQTANRLKQRIDQARLAALLLGVATAVLAVATQQVGGLSKPAGQALSPAAAITAGLATLIQRRVSTGQIKDWTRARSASEGLKTAIYSYLGAERPAQRARGHPARSRSRPRRGGGESPKRTPPPPRPFDLNQRKGNLPGARESAPIPGQLHTRMTGSNPWLTGLFPRFNSKRTIVSIWSLRS